MNHFNDFNIIEDPDKYRIIFKNHAGGRDIEMNIPRSGVFDNTDRMPTRSEVEGMARQIGNILSKGFHKP